MPATASIKARVAKDDTRAMRKRGAAMESLTDASRVVNLVASSGLIERAASRTAPVSDSGGTLVRTTICTSFAAYGCCRSGM